MKQRANIRLRRELLLRAKRKAAAQGRTLTSLIEDGLRLAVAEQVRTPSAERVMPPISEATGGPMPGIDLADPAMLQDAEDLAYVVRIKGFE